MTNRIARWIAIATIAAAAILHALRPFEGGLSAFVVGLFVWSMLPYAVCLGVALRGNALAAAGGALAALTVDGFMHYRVFVAPTSSTEALGLLSAPLANLLVSVPLGALAGLGISRWSRPRMT